MGDLSSGDVDGILYISKDISGNTGPEPLRAALAAASVLDSAFANNITIIQVPLPAKRLIFSPVGKLTDYDDVRSFGEAAKSGMKRAVAAGVKNPLLVLPESSEFPQADLVTLLGSLEALYVVNISK